MRLAVVDLVAGDHGGEGALGQGVQHRVRERPPRHGHQGARHSRLAQRRQQLDGTRAPRHVLANLVDDPPEQLLDDLHRRQIDGRVVTDELGRDHEVVADELVGVLVAPHSPGLLDDRVLGEEPVGLGVDEGAVHVPEDSGRKRLVADGVADQLVGHGGGGSGVGDLRARSTIRRAPTPPESAGHPRRPAPVP
jgi:hypothetical protein